MLPFLRNVIPALLVAFLTAACGGGGGGGETAAGTPDTGTPAPTTGGGDDGTQADGIYAAAAELSSCRPGSLTEAEHLRVLDALNALRARHGLAAVARDTGREAAAGEAALMMVANRALSHQPPASWTCYSAAGAGEAARSNLYLRSSSSGTLGFPSSSALAALLLDDGVASLGHRRWMLDPFLGPVAWGRADGQPSGSSGETMAGVLALIDAGARALGPAAPDFVAMPQGSYPADLFPPTGVLSVSVVADPANRNANRGRVDFATAAIRVTDPNGQDLAVTNRAEDYSGAGLPNLLSWQVGGLRTGLSYRVRIDGVRVDGVGRAIEYSFALE
ncbi:MAG: hypothetical protein KDH20_05665 [Rhodocyclaceae bacterium]|nr:hypothetical protein [Rhodocyclaceae bacterium]